LTPPIGKFLKRTNERNKHRGKKMTIQELEKTQEGAGQEAMGSIPSDDLNITAPGKLRVIKRNGKVVPFEEDKIKVAVTKAFLANESGNAAASERIHRKVEEITADVQEVFRRRMPSGGTLHIEEIQDQVELQLMRNEEYVVARKYILYREERAAERTKDTPQKTSISAPKISVTKKMVQKYLLILIDWPLWLIMHAKVWMM
jgi:ribonucleoside-diphosphate reductase alpha chain